MTNNQINYAKHREDVRHNERQEAIGQQQADAATSQAQAAHRQAGASELQAQSAWKNTFANALNAQAALSQAAAAHRNATTNYINAQTNIAAQEENVRHNMTTEDYMSEYYDYAKYSNPIAVGKGLLNSAKGLAANYAAKAGFAAGSVK